MDKPIVCFSFDDGRLDNYTIAYPILKKYGLSATFNITTGYIEGKLEEGKLTHAKPMTVEMTRNLYQDKNIEIACHGYWHLNTFDDIIEGERRLCADLNISQLYSGGPIGFASPGSSLDLCYYSIIKKNLKKHNIVYVRLSQRYLSMKLIKVLLRKLARLCHLPLFFRLSYQDSLLDRIEDDIIYSVPIMASTTVSEIKELINYAIKEKKSCVLMWHSIVPDEDIVDNFDFSKEKFERLCHWLKYKQELGTLFVAKTIDLYKELSLNRGNK